MINYLSSLKCMIKDRYLFIDTLYINKDAEGNCDKQRH